MRSKASPPPRKPLGKYESATNSLPAGSFALTSPSVTRKTLRSVIPEDAVRSSISQLPFSETRLQEDGEGYSPSELIVPFHLDLAAKLLKHQERNENHLQKSDILGLQVALDNYAEGLLYSTRQMFMHENKCMVQQLQRTKDVSATQLFLQVQRELRQLVDDDSAAKERQLIEKLSALLEV
ncbi:hypothetical protein DQ04_04851030 [Trypanosoma grayi]|uniref:hypothetical protein n=1 Tax=Trypanosoma grayi TaxID=71804 RepID=UPI0004F40531|nr:hypothetical protein DQ04_04851030 [Trypanosoma grayi]KEG09661.1 hypothetical protein DQ04_04851030 [Trypanosoma grayi]